MKLAPRDSAGWIYSQFYFASVSLYAFILGFFPLHCKDIGFDPLQISLLSALATAANLFGPPLMLHAAHAWVAPRLLVSAGSAAAVICFIPLLKLEAFVATAVLWLLTASLCRGAASVVDAQAIRDSALGAISFERVRLWGSVGFIVVTYVFGTLVDVAGNKAIMPIGLAIIIAACCASFPASGLLAGRKPDQSAESFSSLFSRELRPTLYRVGALLGASALVSASHSVLYVYMSLYLDALGWSATMISSTWTLGVLAEISFFIVFRSLETRMSLTTIFKLSIAAAAVRWLILYYFTDMAVILASQLLHGLSFGGCYVASMKLIYGLLPAQLKDRGQGILALFGSGMGSLLGRVTMGAAAGSLVSYRQTNELFAVAAITALAGLLVSYCVKTPVGETN